MADKEIKYSGAWKVYEDCGCVLYLEYPSAVCPACAAIRMASVKAEVPAPEPAKPEKESKGKA